MESTSRLQNDHGITLLELLVSLLLSTVVLGAAADMMFGTFRSSLESEIVVQTEERARSTLDLMLFDLRMLGSGVALGQTDFEIGGDGLGDAPLPVLADSDDEYLHFRMNETGKDTLTIQEYTPGPSSLSFQVASAEDLLVGDLIYLSDKIAGGDDGLQGTIDAISGTTITIEDDYVASADAVFPAGSTVNRVSEIEYTSPDDADEGITRNNGLGAVTLIPKSSFSIRYLDADGDEITLPLSEDEIANDLTVIELSLQVVSERPLETGEYHTATASTQITARSMFFIEG